MNRCSALGLQPVSKADATKGEGVIGVGTPASEYGFVGYSFLANSTWLSDPAGAGHYLRLLLMDGATEVAPEGSVDGKAICYRTLK